MFDSDIEDIFAEEDPVDSSKKPESWKILVVDDDEDVHTVTHLSLEDVVFKDKSIEILDAYSAQEGMNIFREQQDIALILLDVVMEAYTSGLDLIKFIREELKNNIVRIVLRTGQPGYAPEKKVMLDYEIDDYKTKTELTHDHLFTVVISNLRSYNALKRLDEYNRRLENMVEEKVGELKRINSYLQKAEEELRRSNIQLELRVKERTVELIEANKKLREAQRIARLGSWEWDIEKNTFKCSNEICSIFGLKGQEYKATYDTFLNAMHPEDMAYVKKTVNNALNNSTPYSMDYRIILPDNSICFAHEEGKVFCDEKGNPIRMIGTVNDVTAIRKAHIKIEEEIRYRLHIEDSLVLLSRTFAATESPDFSKTLVFLRDLFKIHNAWIFIFNGDDACVRKMYSIGEGEKNQPENFQEQRNHFPWFYKRVMQLENIVIYDTDNMLEEAGREKQFLLTHNVKSFLGVPINISRDRIYGFTAIGSIDRGHDWSKENLRVLRIVNEMMANYFNRKESQEEIIRRLGEKEVLLKEIHHRVKNNLQLVTSLLYLQSTRITNKEVKEILNESQNRIQSMAIIHEKLYQSENFASINVRDYFEELSSMLFNTYRDKLGVVNLKLSIDNIQIGITQAIPCGLIINELISNSLKYAFSNIDKQQGEIEIRMTQNKNEKKYTLVVKDNGIGFPEEIDFRKAKSLGMTLLTALSTKQLRGNIELNNTNGTEFIIVF